MQTIFTSTDVDEFNPVEQDVRASFLWWPPGHLELRFRDGFGGYFNWDARRSQRSRQQMTLMKLREEKTVTKRVSQFSILITMNLSLVLLSLIL